MKKQLALFLILFMSASTVLPAYQSANQLYQEIELIDLKLNSPEWKQSTSGDKYDKVVTAATRLTIEKRNVLFALNSKKEEMNRNIKKMAVDIGFNLLVPYCKLTSTYSLPANSFIVFIIDLIRVSALLDALRTTYDIGQGTVEMYQYNKEINTINTVIGKLDTLKDTL